MFIAMAISALLVGAMALGPFLIMVLALAAILLVHSLIMAMCALIMAMCADEETYACYVGAAATGFNIGLIWAPLGRAVQVIASMAGYGLVAGSALWQCVG